MQRNVLRGMQLSQRLQNACASFIMFINKGYVVHAAILASVVNTVCTVCAFSVVALAKVRSNASVETYTAVPRTIKCQCCRNSFAACRPGLAFKESALGLAFNKPLQAIHPRKFGVQAAVQRVYICRQSHLPSN